jgi:hypothetical protein
MRSRLAPLLLLLLTACPNMNTYGVPRTIRPGDFQHTIAPEIVYMRAEPLAVDGSRSGVTQWTPTVPTYQLRAGVAERVELGFRLVNLAGPGADVKWNFVRGDIDLAVMPGIHWVTTVEQFDAALFHFHLPLMIGFRIGETTTLVLTPGTSYGLTLGRLPASSSRANLLQENALFVRMGVGVNFRVSRGVSLHPEVTLMRGLNDAQPWIGTGGVGLLFGDQPRLTEGEEEGP